MKRILIVIASFLTAGCAATVFDVIKQAESEIDLPTRAEIEKNLKGCGFLLGAVKTKLRKTYPKKFHPWPDKVYQHLLEDRLDTAFLRSGIRKSHGANCLVSVTITEAKFGNEAIISAGSIFAATSEVFNESGKRILVFPMQTGWTSLTSVIVPPVVTVIPFPRHGPGAHSYELAAMAILITKTLSGLRQGKTFDEMKFEESSARAIPGSDILVRSKKDNPWQITPVGIAETKRVAENLSAPR